MVIGGLVIFEGPMGLTGFGGGFAWAVGCRGGGVEEGNLVVAPAASLRRYHPCEQTDARSGLGSSAEWKGPRPGEFMARLKPCPFDGLGWVRLVWQHGNPTRDQVLSRMGHPARGPVLRQSGRARAPVSLWHG
jgi:hypothetical protein